MQLPREIESDNQYLRVYHLLRHRLPTAIDLRSYPSGIEKVFHIDSELYTRMLGRSLGGTFRAYPHRKSATDSSVSQTQARKPHDQHTIPAGASKTFHNR